MFLDGCKGCHPFPGRSDSPRARQSGWQFVLPLVKPPGSKSKHLPTSGVEDLIRMEYSEESKQNRINYTLLHPKPHQALGFHFPASYSL